VTRWEDGQHAAEWRVGDEVWLHAVPGSSTQTLYVVDRIDPRDRALLKRAEPIRFRLRDA
jgi:hypothetical protein